jgi:hypothetical protein
MSLNKMRKGSTKLDHVICWTLTDISVELAASSFEMVYRGYSLFQNIGTYIPD